MTITEGEVLLGKYRVEQVLGRGGMGVVVAARHIELGELFAIKLLLPQAPQSAAAVERFVREARASARLKGAHAVKVHDVGRMDDGAPYMIMEHLAGTDLQGLLRTRGLLPVDEVVTYVLQVCDAVTEAHSLGIVHRDLKPANMFLIRLPNGSPCVKVIDFGISKQIAAGADAGPDLTQAGTVLGSPLYMSPEQIQGRAVDVRSDIWALGAVLFELLTGKPPFNAPTLGELASKLLLEAPPSPADLRAGIQPELCAIVRRCLEKQPERRYQSVAALAADLEPIAASQRFDAPSSAADPTTAPGLDGLLASTSAVPVSVANALPAGALAAEPADGAALLAAAAPEPRAEPPEEAGERARAVIAADPASPVALPAPARRGPALRFVVPALVAAAVGGTALLLHRLNVRPPALTSAPSATEAPPSPAGSKSKKWWDDLPDTMASAAPVTSAPPAASAPATPTAGSVAAAAAAQLPAPRFRWLQLHNKARKLELARKLEEAQSALHEALEIARGQLGVEDAAYPETLQMLARIGVAMGKIQDAEKLLREACQVLTKYGDPSEEGYDDARQALVAVLRKQGKNDEARQLWKDGDPPLPEPSATAAATAAPTVAPLRRAANPFEPWGNRHKDKEAK